MLMYALSIGGLDPKLILLDLKFPVNEDKTSCFNLIFLLPSGDSFDEFMRV